MEVSVRCRVAGAPYRPRRAGLSTRRQRPDERDQDRGDHREDQVERRADPEEVGELVAARPVDQRVGLVADRRREGATRATITATTSGRGSTPMPLASAIAIGVITTATALFVMISVRIDAITKTTSTHRPVRNARQVAATTPSAISCTAPGVLERRAHRDHRQEQHQQRAVERLQASSASRQPVTRMIADPEHREHLDRRDLEARQDHHARHHREHDRRRGRGDTAARRARRCPRGRRPSDSRRMSSGRALEQERVADAHHRPRRAGGRCSGCAGARPADRRRSAAAAAGAPSERPTSLQSGETSASTVVVSFEPTRSTRLTRAVVLQAEQLVHLGAQHHPVALGQASPREAGGAGSPRRAARRSPACPRA